MFLLGTHDYGHFVQEMSERDTKAVIPVQIVFSFFITQKHCNFRVQNGKCYIPTLCRGGSRISRWGAWTCFGGCGTPTRALFGEKVCENVDPVGGRADPPMF